METTTTAQNARPELAASLFDQWLLHDDFLGYGYIGERARHEEDGAADEDIAASDALVLEVATAKGWTEEQLFEWANSKAGRWFADLTLGSGCLTSPGEGARRDADRARKLVAITW